MVAFRHPVLDDAQARAVRDFALAQVGKPYVLGGNGPEAGGQDREKRRREGKQGGKKKGEREDR